MIKNSSNLVHYDKKIHSSAMFTGCELPSLEVLMKIQSGDHVKVRAVVNEGNCNDEVFWCIVETFDDEFLKVKVDNHLLWGDVHDYYYEDIIEIRFSQILLVLRKGV